MKTSDYVAATRVAIRDSFRSGSGITGITGSRNGCSSHQCFHGLSTIGGQPLCVGFIIIHVTIMVVVERMMFLSFWVMRV